MNVHHKSCLLLAALVGLYGAGAGQALAHHGGFHSWLSGNGSFQNPLKWSPNGVPGPADFAEFNYSASSIVTFAANATTLRLFVSDFSTPTLDLGGFTYTLSAPIGYEIFIGAAGPAGGSIQLTLTNGTVNAKLASLGGWDDGTGGQLLVSSGATLNIDDVLLVGEYENSALNVASGGDVFIPPDGHLVVGFDSFIVPTTGTVYVQGAGSTLNAGEHLHLGWFGNGEIIVWAGGAFSATSALLGQEVGSSGTATVHSGGSWTTLADMQVGAAGDGSITVSDAGTTLSNGMTNIALTAASTGVATIERGATASLGDTIVGVLGDGSLTIQSGASVSSGFMNILGDAAGATGTVTVTGAGSSWTQAPGLLTIGLEGTGTMNITAGATVSTMGPEATIAMFPGSTGSVTVAGAGSSWSMMGNLGVGGAAFLGGPAGGTGSLTVGAGATVSVPGLGVMGGTTLWPAGTITLTGGTLTTPRIIDNGGTLVFTAGTLTLTDSDITIGSDGLLGASPTLGPAMTLDVSGTTSIESGASLSVGGGTFSTGDLVADGAFIFDSGTVNITGPGGLMIGAAGALGDSLVLDQSQTVNMTAGTTVASDGLLALEGGRFTAGVISNSGRIDLDGVSSHLGGPLANSGLVTGDGQITGTLTNLAAGIVRASTGEHLRFTGAGNTNAGQIALAGGTVEFQNTLTNDAGGNILGRGVLVTASLTNSGDVAFSSGVTDVYGDVTNASGGRVTISGNSDTTFWDDVTHAGTLFRVSAGSSATFFGTFSPAGSISGTGTVYIEADLTPGASPALVSFGGDVNFGPLATLHIELGGTTIGTEYDSITIAGTATLDGTLDITLLDLGGGQFMPELGDTFEILTAAGGVAGSFAAQSLPSLTGFLDWNLSTESNGILLSVVPLQPGDYNVDGTVDAADYVVWRKNDGTQAGHDIWRANFGQTAGSGSAAIPDSPTSAVPEPASLAPLLLAAAGLFLTFNRTCSSLPARRFFCRAVS
ncbi:MAG: hypothetical protein WD738_02160 [Pirellulales bacterium]